MTSQAILNRLIQLLKERNFVERCVVPFIDGCEQTIYNYGPAGALLRYNILSEWRKFSIQNADNENCFLIENSISAPTRNVDLPTSNLTTIVKGLRSRLVPGCMEHYIGVLKQVNKRLPFTIAQTGVCYRKYGHNNNNEEPERILKTPFLFDAFEVTDMTQLYFCGPENLLWDFSNYQKRRLHWWRQFANSPSNFQISEIKQTSVGENSVIQSCRILYKFPWGLDTVENLVNWGDGPLQKLRSSPNTTESVLAKKERSIVIPAMIEASALLERGFLALLLDSFREKVKTKASKNIKINDSDNIRCLLKLDNKLTPYKIAVTLTENKRKKETRILAQHVLKEIRSCHVSTLGQFDMTGRLEKQFDFYDQIGVPYIIVIRESSLETGLVDVRSRDTTLKEPVHISKIKEYVRRNLGLQFTELG